MKPPESIAEVPVGRLIADQTQRVATVTTLMLRDQPFFAPGILQMRHHILPPNNPRCPTFATDGRDLFVNAGFAHQLEGREIVTVLTEEVIHCYSDHPGRGRDMGITPDNWRLWNLACDQECRWVMETENEKARLAKRTEPFPWPGKENAPDPRWRGMAPEVIYREMLREQSGRQQKLEAGSSKLEGEAPNGGNPQPGQQSGKGQPQPGQPPTTPSSGLKPDTSNLTPSNGHFDPPPGTEPEQKALREKWERIVLQAHAICQSQGSVPAAFDRRLNELRMPRREPFDNIRDWLTEIGRNGWSMLKPNLRMRHACPGFILPGRWSQEAGTIIVATDTSGSVDDELIQRMQGLKQWILDEWNPEKLIDIYCDAQVQEVRELEPGDTVPPDAPGGGGTKFTPVFERIARDHDHEIRALIYLTDLYGRFPAEAPDYPVIWGVWGNATHSPPFGETVSLETS